MKKLHVQWQRKTCSTFVLNLDSGYHAFGDKTNLFFLPWETITFPGGEPHFRISTSKEVLESAEELIIAQRFTCISDLFMVLMAVDAAKRVGFTKLHLVMPYFPGARQDRVCVEGEPLTAKVMADLINGCGFESVTTLCPHSDVLPALLNNVVLMDECKFVMTAAVQASDKTGRLYVVSPDAGAAKRTEKYCQYLLENKDDGPGDIEILRCGKIRNVETGKLEDFFVPQVEDKDRPILIIDDINCMGGTFIGLANKLREQGCGPITLFTFHSDTHKGIQNLINNNIQVITTSSKENWGQYEYQNGAPRVLIPTI